MTRNARENNFARITLSLVFSCITKIFYSPVDSPRSLHACFAVVSMFNFLERGATVAGEEFLKGFIVNLHLIVECFYIVHRVHRRGSRSPRGYRHILETRPRRRKTNLPWKWRLSSSLWWQPKCLRPHRASILLKVPSKSFQQDALHFQSSLFLAPHFLFVVLQIRLWSWFYGSAVDVYG